MPQLDFIIIFPQIFWLTTIFFIFYIILTHFFLPIFIKLIKSRKQVVLENNKILLELQSKFILKQNFMNRVLKQNFIKIKLLLENEISLFFIESNHSFDFNLVNIKMAQVLYYNTLYYDLNILESISLKPIFNK